MGSTRTTVSPEELTKYQGLADEALANIPEFRPEQHQGKGVVICAGGPRYFTNAYVAAKMLRHQGCELPIQFWHLGVVEMDDIMRKLVEPLGVTCVDAYEVEKTYPARRLFGWELNPYSIIHSPFKEVIFLDADNVPLIDPAILFDTPEYKETGAIFWPDFGRLSRQRRIWEICRIPYRDECEFESGQIVMDKERCWKELNLTMHINEHSDFYYDFVHGDKETYHLAWRMCQTPYSMPKRGIHALKWTMCQHDFQDKRIFQHRNMKKWSLTGDNPRIPGFLEEGKCLEFLSDLRKIWDGVVRMPKPTSEVGKEAFQRVIQMRNFEYHRVGHDRRAMELDANGLITKGEDGLEKSWMLAEGEDGVPELSIIGTSITCTLREDEAGVWRGRWRAHEQMPIELIPKRVLQGQTVPAASPVPGPAPTAAPVTAPDPTVFSEEKRFVYIRVGYDKRLISLRTDNKVGEGASRLEREWAILDRNGTPTLVLGPTLNNPICELTLAKDGIWRGAWNKHEKMDIALVEVP